MANSDEYVINTACVVADYFNHRIEKAGYNWQVSPTRNFNPNNKVTLSMRRLCAEFEKRYKKEFCEMCDTCAKLGLEKDSYLEVLNQLIEGGENGELNWGRVVAIFAFGGQMCVKSMAADKEYEVDYVREWTCAFMKSHVDEWIQRHGGWKAFVDFANPEERQEEKTGWGTFLAGALGAVCLGALVLNRA